MNDTTSKRRKRALIVDDEEAIRQLIEALLGEIEFECLSAPSGEAALAICQNHSLDLLITDKNMPGMNGLELVAEAKKIDPALRTIVVTAHASEATVCEAMELGVNEYVCKPIDLPSFRKTVRATMRSAPRPSFLPDAASSPLDVEAIEPTIGGLDEPEPTGTVRTADSLLVIDDLSGDCNTLSPILNEAGYQVTCFDGPGEAVAFVSHRGYDLLIASVEVLASKGEELEHLAPRRPLGRAALVGHRGVDVALEAIQCEARGIIDVSGTSEDISREIERVLKFLRAERVRRS